MFWCVWALKQSKISTLDFDYCAHAKLRLDRLMASLSTIKQSLPIMRELQQPRKEMRYLSTRGRAPELHFSDALLAGLAEDGINLKFIRERTAKNIVKFNIVNLQRR